MVFMGFSKKGEIETSQIILTVLAILSLVIALLFWYVFRDTTNVSDDTCKLSVLTRATAADKLSVATPLKCTTHKICITSGSASNCPQFLGESDVEVVFLTGKDSYSNALQIDAAMAENMYNCWSLMGEGKLNLFNGQTSPSGFVKDIFAANEVHPTCIICSRVALGNDIPAETLAQIDVPNYLAHNAIPNGNISYLQYFTDDRFRAYPADFNAQLVGSGGKTATTNQVAFIFMQIITDKDGWDAALKSSATTGTILGGALFLSPIGKVSNVIGIGAVPKAIITAVGSVISGGLAYVQVGRNQALSASYCGQFAAGEVDSKTGQPLTKYGCSIIQPIDYNNISAINTLCSTIEGNP